MSNATTAHLDKGALIVTYCDGIRCNGSTKGALNMLQLGFRVKELIGGLDCWRYDGYPIEGLETAEPAGSCGCSPDVSGSSSSPGGLARPNPSV